MITCRSGSAGAFAGPTAAPEAAQFSESVFFSGLSGVTRGIIILVSGLRVPPPLLGRFQGCPQLPKNSRIPALDGQCGFSLASRCDTKRAAASPVCPQLWWPSRSVRPSLSGNACGRSWVCSPARHRRRRLGTAVPVPFAGWIGSFGVANRYATAGPRKVLSCQTAVNAVTPGASTRKPRGRVNGGGLSLNDWDRW